MTATPLHITLRPATCPEIIALRQEVLRPGLPIDTARFDGDEADDTFHFGAFDETGRNIGCVTLLHRPLDGRDAYQLRGMATAPSHRGKAIGTALLQLAQTHIRQHTNARLLWCNARVSATGFYLRHGWRIEGEPFGLPHAGQHYRMTMALVC